MSGIGSGYDLSPSTFSPDGRIFQTEYAQKAVDSGGTVIGLKCKDGVVLGLEKPVQSKLLVKGSGKRLFHVDKHIGAAVAGLLPDGRQIINQAVDEASNFKRVYGKAIPGHVLTERIASYVHLFNLYWYARPYGASVLFGCFDDNGPGLYLIETSGVAHKYFGAVAGKGRQAAKTQIEKLQMSELSCRDGLLELAKILYKVSNLAILKLKRSLWIRSMMKKEANHLSWN